MIFFCTARRALVYDRGSRLTSISLLLLLKGTAQKGPGREQTILSFPRTLHHKKVFDKGRPLQGLHEVDAQTALCKESTAKFISKGNTTKSPARGVHHQNTSSAKGTKGTPQNVHDKGYTSKRLPQRAHLGMSSATGTPQNIPGNGYTRKCPLHRVR